MLEANIFSDQQILDTATLGNKPSAQYLESIEFLDNVVRECMYVSRSYAGIESPTSKHFYASVLFTSLITRGVSLLNLAPHSPWSQKLIEHWDYASATGITRTMLELRLTMHYLCAEECSAEEWDCRWNVFNLHDCTARRRMFEAMEDAKQVAGFDVQAEELRERLLKNSYFLSLQPGQQKTILKGQKAHLQPLEEIGEKAGIPIETFRWLYILFSSHVHGLPMSFYRMGLDGDERGRGLPSPAEENYTTVCLSHAASLLVGARDEMHVLFDGLAQPVATVAGEVNTEELRTNTDAFPVGASVDLASTPTIRITATHTSEDVLDVRYYHVPTNEVVLHRIESEIEGVILQQFDPLYWTVLVDGQPATDRLRDDLETKNFAFKADPDTRTLSIKLGP